jgi:hypothetical protein
MNWVEFACAFFHKQIAFELLHLPTCAACAGFAPLPTPSWRVAVAIHASRGPGR